MKATSILAIATIAILSASNASADRNTAATLRTVAADTVADTTATDTLISDTVAHKEYAYGGMHSITDAPEQPTTYERTLPTDTDRAIALAETKTRNKLNQSNSQDRR